VVRERTARQQGGRRELDHDVQLQLGGLRRCVQHERHLHQGQRGRAEWIAERPAYSIGIAPEAQFSSVPFSAASETAAGRTSTISGYSGTNYDMTTIDATDTYDIATVSGLTGGNAFKASWKNSY
jgi:hypothetical protein